MQRIFPVPFKRSSLIAGLGHDRETERMAVKFRDGRVRFYCVPREVFERFLAAESLGGFYNKFVKGRGNREVVASGFPSTKKSGSGFPVVRVEQQVQRGDM